MDGEQPPKRSQPSSDATLDWAKFTWEAFKGLIAGAAAVFAFFANQQSVRNANTLKELEVKAQQQLEQHELDLKVFELLEKTLALEGTAAKGRGLAAAAIINALVPPPLRDGFLNALYAASKDEALLKQLDEAKEFDADVAAEQPKAESAPAGRSGRLERHAPDLWDALVPSLAAQSPLSALKGFRVDVFYCEAQVNNAMTDGRRKRAQSAADQIRKATNGEVDPKVRHLPMLVQARPEYRSVADEIKYDDEPREVKAAQSLGKLLNIRPENLRKVTVGRTPSSISVFYCGA